MSLQDGLSDRTGRAAAADTELTFAEIEEVVADIFERALETSSLINKDAQNQRSHGTNGTTLPPPSTDFESPPVGTLWTPGGTPADIASQVDALPVSFKGDRKHRRLNALQYLKDRLRDDPALSKGGCVRPETTIRFSIVACPLSCEDQTDVQCTSHGVSTIW
ncbi:hypothetical protein AJ88_15835 [Mesorhizobium amorphae CCBAU 01583]|nr:hypothetical protein AJ88_15835 [Mesorhizobium amorphae CCBAU 01583]